MKNSDIKTVAANFTRNIHKLHEFATEAAIGKTLQELVERCELLTIFHDPEDGTFSVSALNEGERRTGVGDDVISALLHAMSREKRKRCARCRMRKVLTAFSKLAASQDGRNKFCRACESKRVRDWKKVKDGRRGGGPTSPAQPPPSPN